MDASAATLTATRPPAETDWSAFVDAYGRAVLQWFCQSGLPDAEADSLAQDLMRLFHRDFVHANADHSGKFRTWLHIVGRAAWGELMQLKGPPDKNEAPLPAANLLRSEAALAGFLNLLDRECSHQRRRGLLPRIQSAADPTEWDIFYRVVLEGAAEAEVAAQASASTHSVRAVVFRIHRSLQEEFKRVEELF